MRNLNNNLMVPKLIHQIKGLTPSPLVQRCLLSWEVLKENGFDIMYWNDHDLKYFIQTHYPFALNPFINARNHAEAADIARYLLVYHHGGYYVDWDIHLNNSQSFNDLASANRTGYLIVDPINGSFASEHFSANKKEKILMEIINDIVATYDRGERELMNTPQYSGPFRMKYSISKSENNILSIIKVKDIFEYSYEEIRKADKFGVNAIMTHFWEHSWL